MTVDSDPATNGSGRDITRSESPVYDDEMQIVRVVTPLPDLLPRSHDDIRRMRKMQRDAESGRKYVAPRMDLPPPYVDDDDCDEFEDATIDATIENLSELRRPELYALQGPAVEGKVTRVFDNGLLYKIITSDDQWFFYNDTEKYEMHVRFRFGGLSELQPGENVDVFVRSNKEIEASIIVYPGETRELISGKVNGFKCMAKTIALNDDKRAEVYGKVNGKPQSQLERIAEELGIRPTSALDEGSALEYCTVRDVPYVDPSFPPCDLSLYRPGVDRHKLRSLPWRRPCDYIPKSQLDEVRLFRRTIYPAQVSQGELGNSYLISAMACLAEKPGIIRDLFRHPVSDALGEAERSVGAYWVTLNHGGWWYPIVIDDHLPAFREGPEYAHCAVDFRRLWVGLLEKVYAKVHFSYASIVAGDPLEPLQDFTGFPISRFEGDWEKAASGDDGLLKRLALYSKREYLTVLYTPSVATNQNGKKKDLPKVPGPADSQVAYRELGLKVHSGYAVLQVKCFEEFDLALFRIRNPWSTGKEWGGKWCKNDKRWELYPSVQAACFPNGGGPEESDDTFWIEWRDVLTTFAGVGVCHVKSNWYDYRIRGNFVDGFPTVCLEINVADRTDAYIILSQEEEDRGSSFDDEQQGNLQGAALLLSVSRHSGRFEKMVCTSSFDVESPSLQLMFNFARSVALRYTFEPENGPFFVIPRIHDMSLTRPYVLGLLLDTYAGNGITVEFKSLDASCKVFQNMPTFSVAGMLRDVATEYQIRNPRQPTECVGVELFDERVQEFGPGD
uniref:Uncharacterized protein TCIL3000_10_14030 n=1 Tax=Trypanosoma congolense (strain IL3000) TaxID=1068625 RepID=G0UYZ9_TRYCI|nr:unnamed protein product [Trypanosoma congolense IL3000]